MARIQADSVSLASFLTESSDAETPSVASHSRWRRPLSFAVATVALLGVLVAFAMTQSRLSDMSMTTNAQPLMLMQDLRMLGDEHYLSYDSGKSKNENIQLAFDHFVATALSNELNAGEKGLFNQHFTGAMTQKFKGHEKPTQSQWKDWLKNVFEGTKPEITDSMVDHINSQNNGFTVSIQPWMRETTHDDVKSRLGRVTSPDVEPTREMSVSMSTLSAKKEFHAHEKWPLCAVVVRRDHNQGRCGSCWAFAALSVLDSRLCIKTNGDFKGPRGHLSRTYATSCTYSQRDGCKGGMEYAAFQLAGTHGIPTGGDEGCLPYFAHGEGTDHFDQQDPAPPCPHACAKAGYGRSLSADKFKFGGKGTWTGMEVSERTTKRRVQWVMQAIMSEGPVAAGVFVDNAFFAYKSGIFKSSCGNSANHAVAVIGFGGNHNCPEDYDSCPAFFWQILNSWGDQWGLSGEMKAAACVTTDFSWPDPITDSHVSGLPSPLFPGSGPAPASAFEVTSGSCTVDGGNCVLSPKWPNHYDNKQQCKINIKKQGGVKLQVVDFFTEGEYDILKVNNEEYDGRTGPMDVVAKGTIEWTSDHSVTRTGWKICEEPQIAGEDVTCDTVGDDVAKPKGETAIVKCPNACGASEIWGSNPYTTDSALCKAAKHAGLSGSILVKFLGETSPFSGSGKNGVSTLGYSGTWTSMKLSSPS